MTARVVVIPCRNESSSIEQLVTAALTHADHVFVANDGSTDTTADVATAAGATVISVPANRAGLAGVYACGLRAALASHGEHAYIAEMDAGGSHDPAALPAFWAALHTADIAAGCRFNLPGAHYSGAWQRRLLSLGGTIVTNAINGTAFRDATSGFIAYRGTALARLLAAPWASTGHYYQTELRLRARQLGITIVEVPIHYRNSSSSLNWRSIVEALRLAKR
jgi:dolichol-phosphate mannosyltransferase